MDAALRPGPAGPAFDLSFLEVTDGPRSEHLVQLGGGVEYQLVESGANPTILLP